MRVKVRVAFIVSRLNETSVPRVVLSLAHALDPEKFESIVVSLAPRAPFLDDFLEGSIRVVFLDAPRTTALFAVPWLVAFLYREQPDVIISQVNGVNIASFLAAIIYKNVKTIFVEHNTFSIYPGFDKARTLRTIISRLVYKRATRVVAVSKGVVEDLVRTMGLNRSKVICIPSPIPRTRAQLEKLMQERISDRWLEPKKAPILVSVANVCPRKGHMTLIRAVAMLREYGLDVRLFIVGRYHIGDPYFQRLIQLVRELGLEEVVNFTGYQRNPYKYMRAADIFVLASKQEEGFGIVLAEAMACGTPVVSTDCPWGPRDIVTNGVDGLLVPVGDPAALADAVYRLLRDETLREKIRRNALKRSRDFMVDVVARRWEALITEVVREA